MTTNSIPEISCDECDLSDLGRDRRVMKFVIDELVPLVPDSAHMITFDGFDGVGKSTMARHLAEVLSLPAIGLDAFLQKDKGFFLDALRLDELRGAVDSVLTRRGRLVVEGCLVDAALDRVGKMPDFRIYIMKTTRMTSNPKLEWIMERDILCGDRLAEELIAEHEELAKRGSLLPECFGGGGSGNLQSLKRELIRYHCEYRPHNRANIIVKTVRWL